MNLPGRKRKPVHRYAAHQVAVPTVEESVKQLSAKLDQWQAKVLKYATIVPEVMTGYSFVHNTMDMITFDIEHFDRMTNEWVADDTPAMQGIERRINTGFNAGRAAALGHLIEEAYVLVSRTSTNGFDFETLGPTEIRQKNGKAEKLVMVDGDKEKWVAIPSDTTIIRIYTPDPVDRNKASGPHKPLLGLLETMALELIRDQADAISVLAGNGILYIPTEILPDEVDTLDASSTPGSRRGFEEALEDSMVSTISDRARGEAIVPITLYGPFEYATGIRHILPTRSESAKESADRMTAYVDRYAKSVDLPAQVILGMGDSNHWSDWKVDENTWAYHLRPRGQRIADALYAGLVRGIIANLELNPEEYRLVPNATAAIAKSDLSGNALNAYKMGAMEPLAFMIASGFTASDMRPGAEDALLAIISSGPDDDQYLNAPPTGGLSTGAPQRLAAGKPPVKAATILRQATKLANSHQQRLEAIFRRVLALIAEDAARAGRKAAKAQVAGKTAAAASISFAGYDPSVYFDKYAVLLETATNDELFAFLRRTAELTGTDYKQLRSIWANEFKARATHIREQANIAAQAVSKRSFESGKAARIGDNTIRALSSVANGGTNQVNGRAGNTEHPTHAAQDPIMKDALTESVGRYATQYTWIVGDPMRPFEPHQNLDGATWFTWEEYDQLAVDDADSWLPGNVYFPGDHDGCQCEYGVDFVPIEEAT